MADPVSSLPQQFWNKDKKNANASASRAKIQINWLRVLVLSGAIWLVGVVAIFAYMDLSKPQAIVTEEEIIDKRPLEVTVVKPERSVLNPQTEVTVIANKEIQMEQNNRVTFQAVGTLDEKYYYVARVINLPLGLTETTLHFTDQIGNTAEQPLKVTRETFTMPFGMTAVLPWPESEYTLDGNALGAQVDKQHRLLEDYEPTDVVDLNERFGLYTLNKAQLRVDAGTALKIMLDDLTQETGKYVTVASGYRSYTTQLRTYANWVREYGETEANKFSAKPGHSEHQLGTTIDFVSDETNWKITNDFGSTTAGQWLIANCGKYGFIVPYMQDQSATEGYIEESWHFRYVGQN